VKIKLLIIFFITTLVVTGQSYNKKLLISFSPVLGKPVGKPEKVYFNAVFPKLFTNMNLAAGGKISSVYLLNKHIGAGLTFGSVFLNGWSYKNLKDYTSSTAITGFVSPEIYIQSDDFLIRDLKAFGKAGPMFTAMNVKLKELIFSIENNSGKPLTKIYSSKCSGLGLDLTTGLTYAVNRNFNISIAFSWDLIKTESLLYPDTNLSICTLEAGIILKILKDKKYYYQNDF
jgi:hypothetical protein